MQSISKEPQKPHAVASIPVNILRNRFGNIFPCELSCCVLAAIRVTSTHTDDHCRVNLKEIAGEGNSDYINASYLDVSKQILDKIFIPLLIIADH